MKKKLSSNGKAKISLFLLIIIFAIPFLVSLTSVLTQSKDYLTAFGKTHFIIGQKDIVSGDKTEILTSPNQAYFSPDDDIRAIFKEYIGAEQDWIKIAMFTITDKEIAQAIKSAHEKGIGVEIISDINCVKDRFNKLTQLSKVGIPIYIFDPLHAKKIDQPGYMHNKFVIFGKNKEGKTLIWTGSFNFTRTACDYNQENVLILDDPVIAQQYRKQFEKIKNRAQKY